MTIAVTNGYATIADLAGYMTVNAVTYGDDLAHALTAASRQIDAHCARRFWADTTATSRIYWSKDSRVLLMDDAWAITSVKSSSADDGTYNVTYSAGTDYQAEPLNGTADGIDGLPVYRLRFNKPILPINTETPTLQVTAKWGWSAVPDAVRQACLIMAGEVFKLREAPFGVAGFGEMGAVRIGRMSPQATALLRPYRTGDSIFGAA
jgi:hypothetical protein